MPVALITSVSARRLMPVPCLHGASEGAPEGHRSLLEMVDIALCTVPLQASDSVENGAVSSTPGLQHQSELFFEPTLFLLSSIRCCNIEMFRILHTNVFLCFDCPS